jgi:hypothetical protein
MFSSLLGPDRFPDVSTALSTTVVGPNSPAVRDRVGAADAAIRDEDG